MATTKTPKKPFEIYVLDDSGNFSVPVLLSDLIKSGTNGIQLDATSGQMFVVPNGTKITGFAVDGANGIKLEFLDETGTAQSLTADAVRTNTLALDSTGTKLISTVNGVKSNEFDLGALLADINVDKVEWDAANTTLKLTETDGTEHTINLASLVLCAVDKSIEGEGTAASPLQLVGDEAAPGNFKVYGTNGSGVKGWFPLNGAQLPKSTTTPTSRVVVDIPLEGFGDDTKMLWAPNQWIDLLGPDGVAITGPNGKALRIPAYEIT